MTKEIEKLQRDLRALQIEIQKANLSHTVDFTDENGRRLTLAEAILLAKQWREEIGRLSALAAMPSKPKATYRIATGNVVTTPSMDLDEIYRPTCDVKRMTR